MDIRLVEKKRRARSKNKKSVCSSISYTTGDVGLNIERFNRAMGTSGLDAASPSGNIGGNVDSEDHGSAIGECLKLKEGWEEFSFEDYNSDDTVTVVIVDKRFEPHFKKDQKESLKRNNVKVEAVYFNGVVVTGKVSDIIQVCNECCVMNPTNIFMEALSLTEAKRYVRRYYIRPQNIFCSNKAEILKTLIELDDNNCSVYTLNNLGDDKDVSKLMNSDIIYYYDNGILYDKNKVKVMDYDLSIKKEENRKQFANVEKASEKEFKNAYEDRMTDVTELEEELENKTLPFSLESFKSTLIKADGWAVELGDCSRSNNEEAVEYQWEASMDPVSGEVCVTGWGYNVYTEEDGIEKSKYFANAEEAYEYLQHIQAMSDHGEFKLKELSEDAFDLDFDDVNVFGEKLTEARKNLCCICGEPMEGYGNNPEPYKSADKGRCCDGCNQKFVIPDRLRRFKASEVD